jgi:hypothetical protein
MLRASNFSLVLWILDLIAKAVAVMTLAANSVLQSVKPLLLWCAHPLTMAEPLRQQSLVQLVA